ncbi:MAG: bifunctional 2-polyprenyl-6-hydroxyphenol methylase/3-demethylubiquinol 3-O-methyltransferase UbiG [Steroidobacteraceae bacterium]
MSVDATSDPAELAKFEAMASRWWDPAGEFRPLHALNPVRLGFIESRAGLRGLRVLDVGGGGGLVSEGMARRGAQVTGIDLAAAPLEVARLHAMEAGVSIDYRRVSAIDLANEAPGAFDLVTCLEMLEHVPAPSVIVEALARLVRPGGSVICSTINRSIKSYLLAVVGAEYMLGLLPRGTHEYARLIRPSELCRWARAAGLESRELAGLEYDPFRNSAKLTADPGINYLAHFRRPS